MRKMVGGLILLCFLSGGQLFAAGTGKNPAAAKPAAATRPASAASTPSILKLRVASYNTEGGIRADQVLANIRSVKPDIILLQEANYQNVKTFARVLGKQKHYGPYHPNAGEGLAILADGEMTPVKLFDMRGERNFAMAAKLWIGGREILVICAHLKSLPRPLVQGFLKSIGPHQQQAKDIVELIRREKLPTIFGGDLNTLAFTPEFITLSSVLRDTAAAAGTSSQPSIFVGRVGYRIDHIMTRGPWKTHAAQVSLLPGSDHRLIWADLELR